MEVTVLYNVDPESTDCNTNNLQSDFEGKQVTDEWYREGIDRTNYMNFIEYFDYDHIIIPITKEEMWHLKDLSQFAHISLKSNVDPKIDEYVPIIERWDKIINDKKVDDYNDGYFIRLSTVSPKDSFYGTRVWNGTDILKTLASSERCHMSFTSQEQEYIILKKWDTKYVDREKWEFRVFVHNSKVTAISQYHWFTPYDWSDMTTEKWSNFIDKVKQFYDKHNKFADCVMDIYVNEDNGVELVEFNSFGMELASGAALFEWDRDRNVMYGTTDKVEIRIHSIN